MMMINDDITADFSDDDDDDSDSDDDDDSDTKSNVWRAVPMSCGDGFLWCASSTN